MIAGQSRTSSAAAAAPISSACARVSVPKYTRFSEASEAIRIASAADPTVPTTARTSTARRTATIVGVLPRRRAIMASSTATAAISTGQIR